jgi:RNA-directed DNA polymerase
MQTKLSEIKEQLRATRHDGIEAQGQWLAKVLRGWLAYYAVPMSAPAITAFRHHLIEAGFVPFGDEARSIGCRGDG